MSRNAPEFEHGVILADLSSKSRAGNAPEPRAPDGGQNRPRRRLSAESAAEQGLLLAHTETEVLSIPPVSEAPLVPVHPIPKEK
jgi:hypothetical protein